MTKLKALVLAGAAVALVGAACSSNGGSGGGGGGDLTGQVVISGSSTVLPISSLVAETFQADNPGVSISVDGPGTGDGFELFCQGKTDIGDASRQIEDEEITACKQNGIDYVELEIGLDGLTVMTNPANTAVSCLTFGDLYALLGPESQGFASWADANALAKEVGGKGNFPEMPLDITAPGEESGTYDTFIELALGDIIDERGTDEALRPDYQSSPNDNVIIQGMEGSGSSLGFVGFAYAQNAGSGVKELQVDGGRGCVGPSEETVVDSSYPLSRSLYIYVNTQTASRSPALRAFVDYYLTDEGINESVAAAGYVDLPDERVAATRAAWESALA